MSGKKIRAVLADKIPRQRLGSTIFSVGHVAALCGCSPRTVSKWMDQGKIDHFRLPSTGGNRLRMVDGKPCGGDRRCYRRALITFLRLSGMDQALGRLCADSKVTVCGLGPEGAAAVREVVGSLGCVDEVAGLYRLGRKAGLGGTACLVATSLGRGEVREALPDLANNFGKVILVIADDEAPGDWPGVECHRTAADAAGAALAAVSNQLAPEGGPPPLQEPCGPKKRPRGHVAAAVAS